MEIKLQRKHFIIVNFQASPTQITTYIVEKLLFCSISLLGLMLLLYYYVGELTPAQTLDLLSTQNYVLIDIRSEKDKNKTGVPRLPSSAKNRMIAIP